MENPLQSDRHPVASGLLALAGVAVVVGLILGLVALAGARVAGLDEEAAADGNAGGELSMYLPKPQKTSADSDPEITLAPGQQSSDQEQATEKDKGKKKKEKPAKPISLSAGQTTVSPMGRIDLTGTYPGGEGALLQVQRFENGRWTNFPVSPVSVSDQTFATYVQTGRPGVQRFRMLDTDSDQASNEVRVRVQG